jgi:hypothetical protein
MPTLSQSPVGRFGYTRFILIEYVVGLILNYTYFKWVVR